MKIVFCLNHFLPQQVAGTEVYTYSLIKELQRKGIDCLVLIPHYEQMQNKTYWVDGIRVTQYAEPSVVDRSLNMGKRAPEGIKNFRAVLEQEQPDIVHFQELATGNGMTIFHLQAAKAIGAKIIMTFHLAGYSCRTGDLMFKGKVLCEGKIDEQQCSICFLQHKGLDQLSKPIVTVSEFLFKYGIDTSYMQNRVGTSLSFPFIIKNLRENLLKTADICDKLVVLTMWYYDILRKNGVNKDKLTIITQGLPLKNTTDNEFRPIKPSPLRLIFVGRITPYKGVHLLIDALKGMDPHLVSLHIYGSTTDYQYEKACKIASVSLPNVKWMGQLPQSEVIDTMRQYHALCLASTFSEMSPLVIQEAFAAGIPVIASNIYGNAEQVRHEENGLLFEFNNAMALRNQLQRLIDEPDLLQHLGGGIISPRSFMQVSEEYFELYRELVPGLIKN